MTKIIDNGGILEPIVAYRIAIDEWPGGLHGMAGVLGISYDVLRKKLNPALQTHKLLESEAAIILETTQSPRILDSLCSIAGACWFFPDDIKSAPSDMDVLKTSTSLMDGALSLIDRFHEALEDGVVTKDERSQLDHQLMRLHQRIREFDDTARQFEVEGQS
jgi:hypothetical protein